MEESLVTIEIYRDENEVISKVQSDLGGIREYRGANYEEMLKELLNDLLEEFEESSFRNEEDL